MRHIPHPPLSGNLLLFFSMIHFVPRLGHRALQRLNASAALGASYKIARSPGILRAKKPAKRKLRIDASDQAAMNFTKVGPDQ